MSLNKTQLIASVAGNSGLTKVDAEKAVNSVIHSISHELSSQGSVTLVGFGTFSVYERASRVGKNPRTGDTIKIPAKKVPKFKAGKALAEMVSQTKKGAKKKAATKKK
jgi:DNA-binding protein HU-beta